MDFNQIFRERTKLFSIQIIKYYSELPYSDAISIIRKQIIRSSTSVAGNYRAVCRARSDNEKFSKLCIVVEEADETQFWLEITDELKLFPKNKIDILLTECEELVKVMTAYKYKLSNKNI